MNLFWKRLWRSAGAVVCCMSALFFVSGHDLESAAQETHAVPAKPRPAEIMRLAPFALLLDIQKMGDSLIAVGDHGDVVVSADGKKWEQAHVPVRAMLTAAHFPDSQNGYVVGHDATIIATKDGGKTWVLQNFQPELEQPFLDVLFLDADHGYAVGAYGLLLGTRDGGKTWSEVNTPIREDEVHFNAIVKLNNGDLFIAGEQGMLAVSSDMGATWERVESPYDFSFFGALPYGEKGALIYGLRGNVFVTADVHRERWQAVDTRSVVSLFGGATLEDGRVALVGLNGEILFVDVAQSVSHAKSPAGTSISAAIERSGNLLVVGDSGVQEIPTR